MNINPKLKLHKSALKELFSGVFEDFLFLEKLYDTYEKIKDQTYLDFIMEKFTNHLIKNGCITKIKEDIYYPTQYGLFVIHADD